MSHAKNGLRALSLSFLAVLGLTAFAAAGAQGQSAGIWLDLAGGVAKEIHFATFTGAQEGNGSLLVAKLNMAIECTTADVEEGKLELGGVGHLKLKFLNCITKTSALGSLTVCRIGQGKTITANLRLLARLASAAHGNEPFVLAEALTGTNYSLVQIENETGKFCSVSGDYVMNGSVAFKVLAGHQNPQLLVPYANQALLGDSGLNIGVHPATLDASLTMQLASLVALAGVSWGVC